MADARIIDGKRIAAGLRQHVAEAAALLRDTHRLTPGLATILVGDDPASRSYIRAKGSACLSAGLASFERRLPGDTERSSARRRNPQAQHGGPGRRDSGPVAAATADRYRIG